jgi:hypothetical protein
VNKREARKEKSLKQQQQQTPKGYTLQQQQIAHESNAIASKIVPNKYTRGSGMYRLQTPLLMNARSQGVIPIRVCC